MTLDTSTGAGQFVGFANETIAVTDDGSDDVTFTLPEGAISAVIHATDGRNELIALSRIFALSTR